MYGSRFLSRLVRQDCKGQCRCVCQDFERRAIGVKDSGFTWSGFRVYDWLLLR